MARYRNPQSNLQNTFYTNRRCKRSMIGTDLFGRIHACNCAGDDFLFEHDYRPWTGQQPTERPLTYDMPPRTPLSLYCTFCKTDEKPYEMLVSCAELIIQQHFGKNVVIRTNGPDSDFDYPRILTCSRLGLGEYAVLDEEFGLIRGYFHLSDAIADANRRDCHDSQAEAGDGDTLEWE